MQEKVPIHVLPVIVLAQFAGTSLWFAGNAVVGDLIRELNLSLSLVGYITISVQLGFILGTLLFAYLSLADRFSPVKVFLLCAIAGSAVNLLLMFADGFQLVMAGRTLTGFFLAGIYPVGMKIASDWYQKGLGKALGYLVGALVLGTAFPHLLRWLGGDLPWRSVISGTSVLAVAGGLLLYFTVIDGPHHQKSEAFRPSMMIKLFQKKNFRYAAMGYFGHMWELYTFWAFVPVMLSASGALPGSDVDSPNVSFFTFLVIGTGGISCALLGKWSLKVGSKKVAQLSLMLSGSAALLLPFLFSGPAWLILAVLFVWGFFVIPDSPQFSTLVAKSCDPTFKATGLTIVNSMGFAITIVSIQLVNYFWAQMQNPYLFLLMLPGPVLGLISIHFFNSEEGLL